MKIAIGGNIGAGKSTFAEKLADILDYSIAEEPNKKCPFLDKFYKNPKEYAFKTQVFFISSRKHSLANHPSQEIIFDRTIFEDKIFAETQHLLGHMDDDEKTTYDLIYEALMRDVEPPDLYININASPSTCLKRVKKRGRSSESSIDLQYLQVIDSRYDIFWNYIKEKVCPIIEIDAEVQNLDYQPVIEFIKTFQA